MSAAVSSCVHQTETIVDEQWLDERAPFVDETTRAEIVALGWCPMCVIQRFGMDLTRRTMTGSTALPPVTQPKSRGAKKKTKAVEAYVRLADRRVFAIARREGETLTFDVADRVVCGLHPLGPRGWTVAPFRRWYWSGTPLSTLEARLVARPEQVAA